MNKSFAKEIIYTIIAITIGIIAVKFIIWLLPIILVAVCGYYIYKFIKKTNSNKTKITKTKNKPIKIIDMVEED